MIEGVKDVIRIGRNAYVILYWYAADIFVKGFSGSKKSHELQENLKVQ